MGYRIRPSKQRKVIVSSGQGFFSHRYISKKERREVWYREGMMLSRLGKAGCKQK